VVTARRSRLVAGVLAACAASATSGGCSSSYYFSSFDTNDFSGDPYPINVETSSGAIVVGLDTENSMRTAVLDVLSPVTLIDRGAAVTPSRSEDTYMSILGARGPGGALDLPRGGFAHANVLTLHPCTDAECAVGTAAAPRPFDAIIGMDTFASDALRLHLTHTPADDQIYILPDIAGDEQHRSRVCDAVLPTPFRGGGTMLIGGTELGYTNWRIAIGTCLQPDPVPNDPAHPTTTAAPIQRQRGADVLLVVSTGIGTSLLGESAYARYRDVFPTSPQLGSLPSATIDLASGPVTGHLTSLPSLALVGNWASYARAPCRQVYASHLLIARDCRAGEDGPCSSSSDAPPCTAPAIVELAPNVGIPFLIVPDANDTLQALRAELRPDQPEVDGVLGTSAFRDVELDIDYVHDRLLGRCSYGGACTTREIALGLCGSRATCSARPEFNGTGDRAQLVGCIGPNAATGAAIVIPPSTRSSGP
jgi:hypothetical protein